jgi:hypothetical protein
MCVLVLWRAAVLGREYARPAGIAIGRITETYRDDCGECGDVSLQVGRASW